MYISYYLLACNGGDPVGTYRPQAASRESNDTASEIENVSLSMGCQRVGGVKGRTDR
jgi:hypothetical protein